jgi:hypothetical protein
MAWRCNSPNPWRRQGRIIAAQCSICAANGAFQVGDIPDIA